MHEITEFIPVPFPTVRRVRICEGDWYPAGNPEEQERKGIFFQLYRCTVCKGQYWQRVKIFDKK